MAFYKNPIIEEPPKCIVCSVVMEADPLHLICSATCEDIWDMMESVKSVPYDFDKDEAHYD